MKTISLRLFGLFIGLLGAANSQSVQAGGAVFDERCVGTVAELDSALSAAQTSVDNMLIKFNTGTWNVGGSLITTSGEYRVLRLEGGYNSDCSSRTVNASNTILNFGGQIMLGLTAGDFVMEGFRVINLNPNSEFKVRLNSEFINASIDVRNNEIVGNRYYVNCTDSVDGVFALLANNRVSGSLSNGLELDFSTCDTSDGLIQIYNNTVANNAGRGIAIETELDQTKFRLANNIAWGNPLQDIFLTTNGIPSSPATAKFYHNTYSTKIGNEGSGSTGTLNSNPQFINVAGDNFQIQTFSPAVNSGSSTYFVGDVDVLGRARVTGSVPDRGAYETGVDDAIATTQIVTNTNDSGAGSLRQAIINANASTDFTFIDFDIPGACPQTITLLSNLPSITNGTRINGFTQPTSAANTRATGDNAKRCVLLVGNVGISGIQFAGNSTSQFWIQGIVFSNFSDYALFINGGVNNIIQGNQFGGRFGNISRLSDSDINIKLGSFSDATTVGGDAPAQRNVLAGSDVYSIEINGGSFFNSNDNQIVNNLFGTSGLEVDDFGSNNHTVYIETARNTIRNNVIVNGARTAIYLTDASNNVIQNNRIGRKDPYCVFPPTFCIDINAGVGWSAIYIVGDSNDNQIIGNSIWNGTLGGVSFSSGLRNKLSGNSFYQNGDAGIVLGSYNGTDNDALPATTGFANRGLNYPVIQTATGSSNSGSINGTLSTSNGTYRVEIFSSALADSAARGEGEIYHGGKNVTITNGLTTGNGIASFSIPIGGLFSTSNFTGRYFVATATDVSGNTSEFSPRVVYSSCEGFRDGFEDVASGCSTP